VSSLTAPLVIAYDGSDDAAKAIAAAGRLIAPRPALVVTAIEESGPTVNEAEQLAADGAQLALTAGLQAQPLAAAKVDKPVWTIIAAAEDFGAAAIVAGARGRSGVGAAMLGSVSTGLTHFSPVPVLVVPSQTPPDSTGPALICFDGSDHAERAIRNAAPLLAAKNVLVLHITTPEYLDDVAAAPSHEIADAGTALATEAGFAARPLYESCDGPIWSCVLAAAAAQDASVIVLGTRGLTGLRSVLGSVSQGVLHHSKRPLLVVP
jgi:nucleotide-binding universal stress UspA family protein